MLTPATTQQYPHVKPDLPPRTRGVIALMEENCTVCMLCAGVPRLVHLHRQPQGDGAAEDEGGATRTRNILDRFAIDFALCMYCGICVEVCPFDALFWSPEFEYSTYSIAELTHEKDSCGSGWTPSRRRRSSRSVRSSPRRSRTASPPPRRRSRRLAEATAAAAKAEAAKARRRRAARPALRSGPRRHPRRGPDRPGGLRQADRRGQERAGRPRQGQGRLRPPRRSAHPRRARGPPRGRGG
jgi:NADH-quinone oxidoreductase subunit I